MTGVLSDVPRAPAAAGGRLLQRSIALIVAAQAVVVGLQVIGRHHEDALLLDLALLAERTCPWPLVAPGAPV